jgi:hypothetical protein
VSGSNQLTDEVLALEFPAKGTKYYLDDNLDWRLTSLAERAFLALEG